MGESRAGVVKALARRIVRPLVEWGRALVGPSGKGEDQVNLALVIGCARSGTSILGELVAAHPDVTYIFEPHEVWEIAGLGENESHRLTARAVTSRARDEIRGWFVRQGGARRLVVDKTPRNVLRVPFIRAVFPEAKLVHIVRDGRDVACSMLPGIGGAEWSHLKPPSWKELFARHQGVVRCALAWRDVLTIALDDLTTVEHLEVRYEDLVRSPSAIAARVLAYLGLPAHPAVTAFCAKIQDGTADSYHAGQQDHWYRGDHRARVGRWRENLTEGEQREISALIAPVLRRLGYERGEAAGQGTADRPPVGGDHHAMRRTG